MSSSAQQDVPVSNETLLLIGPILCSFLNAACRRTSNSNNADIYHVSFPNDGKIMKSSVYTIFLVDILQTIFVAVYAWRVLCFGWGRPALLPFPGWSLTAIPTFSAIVSAWVQIFYAWRIHILSGRKRIIPCVIIIALAQASGAIAITAVFSSLKDLSELHTVTIYARTILWLAGSVAADAIIAFSMIYLLYNAKNSGFGHTNKLINRLIRLTIETGLATALTALVELILYQVYQNNNLHLVLSLCLCKVYSNTFMTSLNSRASSGSRGPTVFSSRSSENNTSVLPRRNNNFPSPAVIHIETTTDRYVADQSDVTGGKGDVEGESMEMAVTSKTRPIDTDSV
ncbi:uncharacterized protein FOMMEDRAFT_160092 [Fomitiporia mediterranea MF3/22]|uniref:uncharacterized protein n=1 Tax=Fomitiporia mediterranea (strain MF3/22) TaxID=694068 RepID=UPI0004407AF3|nr:uncharacterized protein FOMMEDRAFT_160092 [Fomitiporia mediterranea MF3/22]EJC99665.1 hypothetical protein FOMMEDRAFT_160092 [Fomitiporia mediterranea MF3/22]